MEAPGTSIPATPSNFGDVQASRTAAAEANGGIYQPQASNSSTPREASSWGDPPPKPQKPESGQQQEAAPEQQLQSEQQGDVDQLYDEHGQPIDMQAYQAQRAEVMQSIMTAIDEGRFPIEQLKDLPVTVKVNGEDREVPFEEAIQGYQRRADYTRKLEEAHSIRAQAEHVLQLERGRNMEWRDPNQLRAGLRMMGLEESFARAAYGYAQERVAYNRLPPSERALHDRLQQEQFEKMQMQEQLRQQQRMAQQQGGPDPATQHVAKQLEQLMPRAFRAHGIGNYPLAQQTFLQQLQAFCPDGEITPQRVNDAAIATKEFLADLAKINAGQVTPNQQASQWMREPHEQMPPPSRASYPLGPRRLSPGSRPQLTLGSVMGQAGQGAGKPGGRRPSDFLRRTGLG